MIHIDTSDIQPSEKWQNKAQALTQRLQNAASRAERDAIIDKNYYWKAFKEELKKLSYGKCWYSEAREIYSHYHVDHFRPKKQALDIDGIDQGGYWWLTYDWKNYRLCGSVGNTKKGDHFPVRRSKANNPGDPLDDEEFFFLDPTKPDDVDLINFDEEGKIKPANPNGQDWEYSRADETIKWFDLNYSDLKDERKRVWKRTFDTITEIQDLLNTYNQNASVAVRERIREKKNGILRQMAPCAELSATVRCCLRSSGLDWAIKMAARKLKPEDYCQDYLDEIV